ncbi:LuxR family transcriptional regulator [Blastococcus sp. URHD0036]|uniref:helix-turn-helix transcriptional regulator n=1 Tax=Blastococcus sp. URHD0036 TaxID=1380356 RepID=UPI00068A28A9|nr:LuxR family transcriptional regulator [Blastococcus sp. URHD0036]
MTTAGAAALAEGRVALRLGDAARARRALEPFDGEDASGDVVEGLARAAYLELDFPRAVEVWERAYAAHRRDPDPVGAVRVARTLSCLHFMVLGDRSVAAGWLARAQTLLAGTPGSREAGWVALDVGMFESDRTRKEDRYREALAIARRTKDTDLEVVTLAYLGASQVHADRTSAGMALLDEALAAVLGRDVDDFFVVEEVFCQLFSACEYAGDVARADEWIRLGEQIAQQRRLPAVSAFCRTHYGGVLTAAGRWPEADAALTAAVRLWGLGRRSWLRTGALVRLAELRVRQGRIDDAAELLAEVDPGVDAAAARPLAEVHLARGETELAADVLERALADDPTHTSATLLWALLAEVHLAAGRPTEAAAAAERAAACAPPGSSPHLCAAAALARAQVCLAAGTGDPQACLRAALAGFSRAQMPMELARCRLVLAGSLRTDRPAVALAEARAALAAFSLLEASRDAAAAAALLRSLGVRPATPARADGRLTRREEEVLEMLGHGLTNPEIAARLFISRRTVEHHVAAVLAKLGLRNRAEAAGHALRTVPGHR